jgi:hypothetical protein
MTTELAEGDFDELQIGTEVRYVLQEGEGEKGPMLGVDAFSCLAGSSAVRTLICSALPLFHTARSTLSPIFVLRLSSWTSRDPSTGLPSTAVTISPGHRHRHRESGARAEPGDHGVDADDLTPD